MLHRREMSSEWSRFFECLRNIWMNMVGWVDAMLMKSERERRENFTELKNKFRVDCRTTCDRVEISMPRLKRFINFQPAWKLWAWAFRMAKWKEKKIERARERIEWERKRGNFMLHWKSRVSLCDNQQQHQQHQQQWQRRQFNELSHGSDLGKSRKSVMHTAASWELTLCWML
jgi:hypothetical protein